MTQQNESAANKNLELRFSPEVPTSKVLHSFNEDAESIECAPGDMLTMDEFEKQAQGNWEKGKNDAMNVLKKKEILLQKNLNLDVCPADQVEQMDELAFNTVTFFASYLQKNPKGTFTHFVENNPSIILQSIFERPSSQVGEFLLKTEKENELPLLQKLFDDVKGTIQEIEESKKEGGFLEKMEQHAKEWGEDPVEKFKKTADATAEGAKGVWEYVRQNKGKSLLMLGVAVAGFYVLKKVSAATRSSSESGGGWWKWPLGIAASWGIFNGGWGLVKSVFGSPNSLKEWFEEQKKSMTDSIYEKTLEAMKNTIPKPIQDMLGLNDEEKKNDGKKKDDSKESTSILPPVIQNVVSPEKKILTEEQEKKLLKLAKEIDVPVSFLEKIAGESYASFKSFSAPLASLGSIASMIPFLNAFIPDATEQDAENVKKLNAHFNSYTRLFMPGFQADQDSTVYDVLEEISSDWFPEFGRSLATEKEEGGVKEGLRRFTAAAEYGTLAYFTDIVSRFSDEIPEDSSVMDLMEKDTNSPQEWIWAFVEDGFSFAWDGGLVLLSETGDHIILPALGGIYDAFWEVATILGDGTIEGALSAYAAGAAPFVAIGAIQGLRGKRENFSVKRNAEGAITEIGKQRNFVSRTVIAGAKGFTAPLKVVKTTKKGLGTALVTGKLATNPRAVASTIKNGIAIKALAAANIPLKKVSSFALMPDFFERRRKNLIRIYDYKRKLQNAAQKMGLHGRVDRLGLEMAKLKRNVESLENTMLREGKPIEKFFVDTVEDIRNIDDIDARIKNSKNISAVELEKLKVERDILAFQNEGESGLKYHPKDRIKLQLEARKLSGKMNDLSYPKIEREEWKRQYHEKTKEIDRMSPFGEKGKNNKVKEKPKSYTKEKVSQGVEKSKEQMKKLGVKLERQVIELQTALVAGDKLAIVNMQKKYDATREQMKGLAKKMNPKELLHMDAGAFSKTALKRGLIVFATVSGARLVDFFMSEGVSSEEKKKVAKEVVADLAPISGSYRDSKRAWNAFGEQKTWEGVKYTAFAGLGWLSDGLLASTVITGPLGLGAGGALRGLITGAKGLKNAEKIKKIATTSAVAGWTGMGLLSLSEMAWSAIDDKDELVIGENEGEVLDGINIAP